MSFKSRIEKLEKRIFPTPEDLIEKLGKIGCLGLNRLPDDKQLKFFKSMNNGEATMDMILGKLTNDELKEYKRLYEIAFKEQN